MKRLASVYTIIGALLIVTVFALWWRSSPFTPSSSAPSLAEAIGAPAPDFALPALDGEITRLSELRGRKIVLNFWASWCGPCRAEMPDLESAYQRYREKLTLLGINLAEEPKTIRRFLEEVRVSYPMLLDAQGDVARAYGVIAQPATYWIDEQGQIVYRKFGAYTRSELEESIRAFLALAPTPPQAHRHHATAPLRHGDLGEKYFTETELAQLGLEIDPSRVPYLADLDLERLQLGCPIHDCIPSIDGPQFETVVEADAWLKPDDLVVSVTHNGVTKAYPVKILNWHEIVNDDFNGAPLVITYCPLCNSSLVFARPAVNGRLLAFGVSGRLYKSDLVMYDRQTGSFWSQIEGRAIMGPLAGTELESLPMEIVPWRVWKEHFSLSFVLSRPTIYTAVGGAPALRRPEAERDSRSRSPGGPQIIDPSTGMTAPEGDFLRDYDVDPYYYYKANSLDTFGTPFNDRRLGAKTTIWGLVLNGAAKAYLPEAVAEWGALNDELSGEPILVLWESERETVKFFTRRLEHRTLSFNRRDGQMIDTETQSIWSTDGEAISGALQGAKLRQLSGIPTFWFAWLAFYPQTELFAR
ncbi:DUF3179 domain-containing protein [Candidatus Acetothermia bacterium]|jgi:peroxiredoxin|nr:DUF3179 domain-containing protein [Candidatus Acetothermia bacterium]MCI2437232.1 DUF3179 domain-containing protein [Candidatus Acetothermia bacterium]